jgi:DNA processing protein
MALSQEFAHFFYTGRMLATNMQQLKKLKPKDFPALLKEIPQVPDYLYIEGELPDPIQYKYLAVVGSRKYSRYGEEVTQKIIGALAGKPVVIVSGLALGIDAIAHEAAIQNKLKTVAIPGSGLARSVLYPANNRKLADRILENGGALISEFEPDFCATQYAFPQRNRIVAGISDTTLVIEAGEKSGALITARLALDYNRNVLTVPGSIFSSGSFGPHYLIRNGATPITNSNDILEAFGFKTDVNTEERANEIENCSDEEKSVLELLHQPLTRDELIVSSELPAQAINTLISMLEIKGLLKEESGEIHRI